MARMVRLWMVALAMTGVAAADWNDYAGTWAMRIGERNLFVLTLRRAPEGLEGTLEKPAHMESNNSIYANMRGARQDPVVKTRLAEGVLHITVRNRDDARDEDSFVMKLRGDRKAEMLPDGLPPEVVIEPRILERAADGVKVATDWEPNRAYVPADSDVSNREMEAIFDEDQRVRSTGHID